jgi:hypothetical protein
VAEPLQRGGHDGLWIDAGLAVSAVLQVIAFLIVAIQLWPRVATKAARAKINRAANDPANAGQEGGS